jgi:hypothetical protein
VKCGHPDSEQTQIKRRNGRTEARCRACLRHKQALRSARDRARGKPHTAPPPTIWHDLAKRRWA